MNITTKIFLVLILLLTSSVGYAQNTIDLSGTVSLDVGVADSDYQVEVSVSNHSFVVISIFPFVALRPLISRVTEIVTIAQGQSSVNYLLTGISTDAVDYVVDFRCDDCGGVFTPQYYTQSGNSFSMNNAVYIDPADLPNNPNFTLTSGASISGTVSLAEGKLAKRELNFLLSVIDSENTSTIFRRISLVIPKDSNSATYSIDKLIRDNNIAGFVMQLECLNCLANSILAIDYPTTLNAMIDNTDIDFEVLFNDITFLPAVPYLLLDEEL